MGDISLILKAKYMSGIQKYFLKYKYIKISQFCLKKGFFYNKAIFGSVITPLYFYHSLLMFLTVLIMTGPMVWHINFNVHRDLFSREKFQIYPLDQMIEILTLKNATWQRSILLHDFLVCLITVVITLLLFA